MDEDTVAQAVFTSGGANTNLPQSAVVPLVQLAVLVGMTTRFGDCGLRFTDLIFTTPLIAFSGFQDVLSVLNVGDTSFDAHRRKS